VTWSPEITEVVGRFAAASNTTLLALTASGERVIYKPIAGEQPLWDFPPETLADREVLTYELSEAMGIGVVPETVLATGPFGAGAVQRFIAVDEEFDPLPLVTNGDDRLWPLAVLDVVTNNADRKVGHLLGTGSAILGIDHGLTFHPEDKLRTVLWAFAGRQIPEVLLRSLCTVAEKLDGPLGDQLEDRLGDAARRATIGRVAGLLADPVHPHPPRDRPPIPWPPY
jgi:hypothetical protein